MVTGLDDRRCQRHHRLNVLRLDAADDDAAAVDGHLRRFYTLFKYPEPLLPAGFRKPDGNQHIISDTRLLLRIDRHHDKPRHNYRKDGED